MLGVEWPTVHTMRPSRRDFGELRNHDVLGSSCVTNSKSHCGLTLSADLLAEQRDEEGGESQEEGGDGRREDIALSSRRIVRTEQRLAHRSFAGEDVRDPCFHVSLVNRLGRLAAGFARRRHCAL